MDLHGSMLELWGFGLVLVHPVAQHSCHKLSKKNNAAGYCCHSNAQQTPVSSELVAAVLSYCAMVQAEVELAGCAWRQLHDQNLLSIKRPCHDLATQVALRSVPNLGTFKLEHLGEEASKLRL